MQSVIFQGASTLLPSSFKIFKKGLLTVLLSIKYIISPDIFDLSDDITQQFAFFNRLTPNDHYMGRTAPLTSKRFILYIYSTNIGTEYFKHALYCPFFPSKCSLFHNANLFGSCIIHILYTGCPKKKKK
jgi:hypothetical protein